MLIHIRATYLFAAALAVLFVGTTVFGVLSNYTPVPFWDMWHGIVPFQIKVLDGDLSGFWNQHVSHRIIFSNLLFYIDGVFFEGSNKFLFVTHLVLMALIVVCFYCILRLEQTFSLRNPVDFGVLMLIIALSFSWIQWRNITWAFQSQMFAANLLPALAFLLLFHTSNGMRPAAQSTAYFATSLLVGFCSAFTMMNGILTLPIMVVLALSLKLPITKVILYAVTSCVTFALFFHGYEKPEIESSFSETLLAEPAGVLTFALTQLGAPFYYIFNKLNMTIGLVGGIFMMAGFFIMSVRLITVPQSRKVGFLCTAILLYILATIGGIATGRYEIGPEQAVESRYMTNALFAWSLFAVMLWHTTKVTPRIHRFTYGFVFLMPLLLLGYQDEAIKQNSWPRWEQNVSVLAVELGVKDQKSIEFVFPWVDILFDATAQAQEKDILIFGHPFYKGRSEQIGTTFSSLDTDIPACDMSQNSLTPVPGDAEYLKLTGLLFSPSPAVYPEQFTIVSQDGSISGFAMTERAAYLPFREPKSHAAWIKGFVISKDDAKHIVLTSETYNCAYTFADNADS